MKLFKKKEENQTKTEFRKQRSIKNKRSEGDQLFYYILYSMVSMLIFLVVGTQLEYFNLRSNQISFLFTLEFFGIVIIVFLWQLLSNFIARILSYFIIKAVYKHTAIKTIYELNSYGINQIGVRFFLSTFLSSLLWSIGAMVILQNQIFGSNDLLSLILTYIIVNITLYFFTKIIVRAKA